MKKCVSVLLVFAMLCSVFSATGFVNPAKRKIVILKDMVYVQKIEIKDESASNKKDLPKSPKGILRKD